MMSSLNSSLHHKAGERTSLALCLAVIDVKTGDEIALVVIKATGNRL